jgi:hypothetical protein
VLSGGGNIDNLNTEFLPFGAFNQSQTESNVRMPVPVAGILSNLQVKLSNSPGGTSKTYVFTLYKNGVATSVLCTATNVTVCSDTAHTVTLAAGDTLSLQANPSNQPASGVGTWSVKLQ